MAAIDYADQRATMVERQLRRRGIDDQRVLSCMGKVPREIFLPETIRDQAYEDGAQPIGAGQTISQPYIVARTCELASLAGGENVLEVGAGSGYQAAVLGCLARAVVAVERIPALIERARDALAAAGSHNVEVVLGDGTLGHPERAPYDRIVVAAAAPRIPPALLDQLADGGRLVVPIGERYLQELLCIEKRPDGLRQSRHEACVFVPLVGAQGWPDQS
jgi:protein-L-isoaspartate(D-aspartate) O-methyltransferase